MHITDGLTIQQAVEEFREKTLQVYKVDPDRIVRDARSAERAAKDHTGRWLFELMQNSDDAGATEVLMLVEDNTVYVADNGHGLKAKAVPAICGTDLSDKTVGTIGRKGVGFKSVYEVTQNPQVLTVDGVGVEFSPDMAKKWLQENNLDDRYVPYQWIPFSITWDDAQGQDLQLGVFGDFKTVVRLPGLSPEKRQQVEQLLREWPPHALFAFRHVRKIKALDFEIVLNPNDGASSLRDSRGQIPVDWRVAKHAEHPPAELLDALGVNERQAISTDGVSFLIAAPLKNGCVIPTSDYLPIHVFYPTEQKGPVRLLLHAEFLVKSDRTAIMPLDTNRFNAWVADRLAYHVCKFVNESFHPESPSSHAALLVPFGDRASHPIAQNLWQLIADKAKGDLRLADVDARQRLPLSEARLTSVSVCADVARTLLEATSVRGQLLHTSFDNDKEAHKALKELGCKEIRDQDLMKAIAENAESLAADKQWVWACWEWLAAWVAKQPYGEEHYKRIEQVKALPIVPVGGRLLTTFDLAGRIVTWKPDADVDALPGWLPLTFVDEWFRDHLYNEADKESPIKKLSKQLGITEPDADVIQRAVGRAIEQYWNDRQGDPGRFLRFIMEQDWHETSMASDAMQRCPVPLAHPIQGDAWAKAKNAYFGREWGNDLLADLYEGCDTVAWVERIDGDVNKVHSILEWLGVIAYPRIIKDQGSNRNGIRANELPTECYLWKQQEFGYTDRVPTVDAISRLEALNVRELSNAQVNALIVLLARHWKEYYQSHSQTNLSWFYYTTRSRNIRAFWWFQISHDVRLVTTRGAAVCGALANCWLPDKRTERAIGDLLPVINIDAFGNDKDAVRDWLINVVKLRTSIEQLRVEEWKVLLSTRIPDKAPAERLVSEEPLRDKVTRWYAACLETVAEQGNVSEKVFGSSPLLCRKGDVWQYLANERRYLDDDNDLATAFAKDVWLFHIPARLAADAVKYFGVQPLSQTVEVNVTPGEPQVPLSGELSVRFCESLPYVWAWRSSQSKQAADSLSVRLKGLKALVVPALKANLSLGSVHHEVERRWHVDDDTMYLHKDHVNETELAQALAKALDVRSEADFYENLLRCSDDRQRKEKLLSKGIADAEIDRCLREYTGQPAVEERDEGSQEPTKVKQGDSIPQTPSGGVSQGQPPRQSSAQKLDETSERTSSGSPGSGKQPLRLKDPSTTPYVLGNPPSGGVSTSGSGEGGGTGREGHLLTDAEKAKLEEAGKTFAARQLESIGYSVEKMPQGNPGFDLRAKKDGIELRVEVKAHAGRATVVEITHREYKEYLHQTGYRWELWNVEHLAEDDSYSVVITRYDHIPDDALDARTFRVDLKKCNKGSRNADNSA